MRSTLFWTLFATLLLFGCEEQMAQDPPEAPTEAVFEFLEATRSEPATVRGPTHPQ